ncbi:MAG: amidohydrolase [Thermodesulfobacteriota bacterium]
MKANPFLLSVLVIAATLVWSPPRLAAASEPADLILKNGKIITVDRQDSIAQAVAVKGGKVIKVGKDRDITALKGPKTAVMDLDGKTVTPGLIDSHYHVMYYGMQFWPIFLDIRFPAAKSKQDLLRIIGERAKQLKKGEWISANQGFHIRPDEILDRWDLDKVAPDNPVYLRHGSGQYAVVNSAALKIAGIDRNTPNPMGAKILHDRNGEPNGVLSHYPAENLVGRYAPGYGDRTEEQLFDSIERGQRLCLEAGYTSTQDVIVSNPRDVQAYVRFAESGRLKIRLYLMLYLHSEEHAVRYIQLLKNFKSDKVVFGGWKLAIDGGPGAGTMLMYDKKMQGSRMAYPYFSQEAFNRIVRMLHDTGLQVAVHVGGDQGIDMTVTAMEEAMKANPRKDPRHRIEHCLFPTPEALSRIKKAGIVVSTSPQWIAWHGEMYRKATSEQSMKNLMPLKSMLRQGVPLAFGCDVPASIYQEPKYAFAGAVFRKSQNVQLNQEERISMQEALRCHTMGSAYAGFAESTTGSLEPGKFADMVVWNHDLYTMKGEQVRDLKPLKTIVQGEVLYDGER